MATDSLTKTASKLHDPLVTLHHAVLDKLSQRYPNSIDEEVASELNRLLAMPSFGFKKHRSSRHLLKIAYSQYLILRDLIQLSKLFPEKKHLELRLIKQRLVFPFGQKPVLGLVLGVNLEARYELLEDSHILQSALACLPDLALVQRSFYSCRDSYEKIHLIYIELMKTDGSDFAATEISFLKKNLPQELKNRIEKLSPTLFTTLNEEEILKSTLILSRELKRIQDHPEVMIFFDQQAKGNLIFSAIIVRILKKGMQKWSPPTSGNIQCEVRRSQVIGYLLKRYPKEAIILRLSVPIHSSFLRKDSSINLYLVRQKVAAFIAAQFGEFRDYNGGIILTRLDLLSKLTQQFTPTHFDFIEHVFHSITPLEMQTTLSLKIATVLVKLFLEGLTRPFSSPEEYIFKTHEEHHQLFVVVQSTNLKLRDHLQNTIKEFPLPLASSLVSASIYFEGIFHLGFICPEQCREQQQLLLRLLQNGIQDWKEKAKGQQILRLSMLDLPFSLDPRLGGDDISGIVLRMLHEGLMRMGKEDLPVPGMASHFVLSPDLKSYTFFLREAYWSNGEKVTAHDFEYAWKKILSPAFKTSFAYLFYSIKNARLAKNGTLPIDAVGVKSLSDNCLQVDLEAPTCHFLEFTTLPLYSPVYHLIDKLHPDWASLDRHAYICNGPFRLHHQSSGESYELQRNEKYWDKTEVKLDKILISKSNPYVAVEQYKKNELDWIGRPLSPWEPVFSSIHTQQQATPSSLIYWYVCNTQCFPLNHPKIRQALCYAIDRQAIINMLAYDALPGLTPLPPLNTLNAHNPLVDGARAQAQQLLGEALHELGLTINQLPLLNFIHNARPIREQIAECIQAQWKDVLGIQCTAQGYHWKVLNTKITHGNYQIGGVSWSTAVPHPLYILDIFKSKANPINYSNWENKNYRQLLDLAAQEKDSAQQLALCAQAEQILIQELPIIPIFYEIDRFVKNPYLEGVHLSKTGTVDFKTAYINGG